MFDIELNDQADENYSETVSSELHTTILSDSVNGNTVHSSLHIPRRGKLLPLNDANKAELRNKYSEVDLSLLTKYQWFQVNYFIRYINV